MELIERIFDDNNISAANHAVQNKKGAPGIDKMPVRVLKSCNSVLFMNFTFKHGPYRKYEEQRCIVLS